MRAGGPTWTWPDRATLGALGERAGKLRDVGAVTPPWAGRASPAALWDPSLAALPDPVPWAWCVGVFLLFGWGFFVEFLFFFFFLERIKKYGFHE